MNVILGVNPPLGPNWTWTGSITGEEFDCKKEANAHFRAKNSKRDSAEMLSHWSVRACFASLWLLTMRGEGMTTAAPPATAALWSLLSKKHMTLTGLFGRALRADECFGEAQTRLGKRRLTKSCTCFSVRAPPQHIDRRERGEGAA